MNYTWERKPDLYKGDDSTRFLLGVTGRNPLVCFGVNPSTANNDYADKTMHMVEQIAKRNDYDGWIMLNLYPLRDKNPKCLPPQMDTILHEQNLEHIRGILSHRGLTLWAAWGEPIAVQPYLTVCLQEIHKIVDECECNWVSFGKQDDDGTIKATTTTNHPRHPSRLPLLAKPKTYNVTHYFKE
ncbi:DUF1643 domain-containing protein [Ruminococcaceae bacterium OttesenSCG-928-L11]|nr:DUF1643 domain-containing protein [Ruminococcaceae bacterium OttesenSCG-928-L11]